MLLGGPKRNDVTGEWKKLHSEELHNLYSCRGHVASIRQERKVYKVLVGKPEGETTQKAKA
jgi:hypothetical protein